MWRIVSVYAGFDLCGVRFDIERFHFRNGFANAMLAEFFIDGCGDLSTGGIGGIAAVEALEEFSVLDSDDSTDDGKGRELFIVCVNADSGAVGAGMKCFEHAKVFCLGFGAKVFVKDIVYEHADGVDLAFGHGSVACFSECVYGKKTAFCGKFDSICFFGKFAFKSEHGFLNHFGA